MKTTTFTTHPWLTALGVGVIVLSFTPWYTLALVALIVTTARYNPFKSDFFASYFVRLVAAFLLLSSVVMLAGMYCWLAGIALHPLFVFIPFVGLHGLLLWRKGGNATTTTHSDWRSNWLAIALGAVSVVILLGSFFLPKPSLSSTVQVMTNGYDHAAHLSLVQTTYEAKGYVYGSYNDVKDKLVTKTLTAYPQGWHLASAFWWRGLGVEVFGTNASLSMNLYLATLLTWQFIAVFLLSRIAIWVTKKWGRGEWLSRPAGWAALVSANLLIQLLVFWGSLVFGFATFIAALAYLMFFTIFLLIVHINPEDEDYFSLYLLSLLAIGAICTTWLLPLPIVVAMFVLTFGALVNRRLLRKARSRMKMTLAFLGVAILTLLPVLLQFLINVRFSFHGSSLITEDGGIFGISSVLATIIVIVAIGVLFRTKKRDNHLPQAFATLVTPAMLFAAFVFVYQLLTVGHASYFFTKCLALALCLAGIFFIPACVKLSQTITFAQLEWLLAPLVVATILITIIIGTGQELGSLSRLLQRKSYLTTPTADAVASLAKSGDLVTTRTFVFTGSEEYSTDVNGTMLTTSIPHNYNQCAADAHWTILSRQQNRTFREQLEICAPEGRLTVITSPKTYSEISTINHPNIRVIEAK